MTRELHASEVQDRKTAEPAHSAPQANEVQ
jgi:hypothetical protein